MSVAPSPVAVSREYVLVWRTDDCAAYESVYVDENGVTCSELLIWDADGSRYREVIGGVDLIGLRRGWEAASPFDKMRVPDDAGRKVWTHLGPEPEDELVELVRMGPSLTQDVPEPAVEDVQDAPVQGEDEAVELEIPPVEDAVARAARGIAIQIWSTGVEARAGLVPGVNQHTVDQYLAHAVNMGWLVVDAKDRIVRGEVDPRPVAITRIPNW